MFVLHASVRLARLTILCTIALAIALAIAIAIASTVARHALSTVLGVGTVAVRGGKGDGGSRHARAN
jgi:hypothetical protein